MKESVFFFSLHKCETTLSNDYFLSNVLGFQHIDYASMIYENRIPERISFERHGLIYGVIRNAGGPPKIAKSWGPLLTVILSFRSRVHRCNSNGSTRNQVRTRSHVSGKSSTARSLACQASARRRLHLRRSLLRVVSPNSVGGGERMGHLGGPEWTRPPGDDGDENVASAAKLINFPRQ